MKLHLPFTLTLLLGSSLAMGQLMDYTNAREAAQKDEQESSPEYVEELTAFYTALAVENMPRCAKETGISDDSLISVVGKIGADGKVLHHWTLGTSKLLPCFVEAFTQATFPIPEKQPYFSVLDMRGNPERYSAEPKPAAHEQP